LASYFFPNYPAHTADNLLFGNNYPSRQEVLNVVGERAVRQFERKESMTDYERRLKKLGRKYTNEEMERELRIINETLKKAEEYRKGFFELTEGMSELREGKLK